MLGCVYFVAMVCVCGVVDEVRVAVVGCVCDGVWMCSLSFNGLKAAGATALAPHLAGLTALQTLE